jgi:hypothetical protein
MGGEASCRTRRLELTEEVITNAPLGLNAVWLSADTLPRDGHQVKEFVCVLRSSTS